MSQTVWVKYFDWNGSKNEQLKKERGISFEEVLLAIENNQILDIVVHSNRKLYPDQKIFIINVDSYAYLVPFVEDDVKVFLKTIIPSRKATKEYLVERKVK